MKELDTILMDDAGIEDAAEDAAAALAPDKYDELPSFRKTIHAAVKPGGLFSVLEEKRKQDKSYCPMDYINAVQIEFVKAAVYLAVVYDAIDSLAGRYMH